MSALGPTGVYLLCLATSLACASLLVRAYLSDRSRFLLGFALGFAALAVNNLLLVADMVFFPHVDLWAWRQLSAGAAIGLILYGCIWELQK